MTRLRDIYGPGHTQAEYLSALGAALTPSREHTRLPTRPTAPVLTLAS